MPREKKYVKIKFMKLVEDVKLPEYKTEGSSGFDFYSIDETIIKPMEVKAISTGLKLADMDQGYEIQIRPRSGLALKNNVTVLNTPGTIDSDYRGEIKIILINLSEKYFKVEKGMRIAQGVVQKVEKAKLSFARKIKETARGEGGFGSTGIKDDNN